MTKTRAGSLLKPALEKFVYLAYRNIRKKWTMPLANWATMSQQLAIKFVVLILSLVGTGGPAAAGRSPTDEF